MKGLSEKQQTELINNYEGDFITNIREIKDQYINPNRGGAGSGDKDKAKSGNPPAPTKGGMLTNSQWKEMRKNKGQSTDFNSWNEYKKSFK